MPKEKQLPSHLTERIKSKNLEAYFKEFESSRNPITNLFYSENHISAWIIRRFGKNLFWKIWAWFATIMSLASMIYGLFDKSYPILRKGIDWITLPFFIIVIIAWAYRKRVFQAQFWKIFTFVFILDNVYEAIEAIITERNTPYFLPAFVIVLVFTIVNIFAVYLYAFKFFPEDKNVTKTLKANKTFSSH